jgi:hypothetical protein
MSTRLQAQAKATSIPIPLFPPVRSGFLQRRATNQAEPTTALPIVHEVLHACGQSPSPNTRTFMATRFGHDFSRVPVRTPAPAVVQPKLTIGQPDDKYEQEADRVADMVMSMPDPGVQRQVGPEEEEEDETVQTKPLADRITPLLQRQIEPEEEEEEEPIQAKLEQGAWLQRQEQEPEEEEEPIQAKPPRGQAPRWGASLQTQIHSVTGGGRSLSESVRNFFEPRFGHDLSQVRVHTGPRASESARAVNAQAYTMGHDIVFGAGRYAPGTDKGRRLLAHELTHVVQQAGSLGPRVQAFTAELDGNKVYIKPEREDTDADLDRILCAKIRERKIAARKRINVTECFPKGTIRAMGLGPYNCADFVRRALGETPPRGGLKAEWLLTPELWNEFLKKGYRIRGFGLVRPDGKVEAAEGLSWEQLHPRMGDVVFMRGQISLKKGAKEPDPAGDNFRVSWDHVGFFIVRSRDGLDYHLAKDGDENPTDVYHTGSELAEGLLPGAYVKGVESLLAYLGVPELEKKTETKTE